MAPDTAFQENLMEVKPQLWSTRGIRLDGGGGTVQGMGVGVRVGVGVGIEHIGEVKRAPVGLPRPQELAACTHQ